MAYHLKHATHLLIASLVEQHLIPGVRLSLIQLGNLRGGSAGAVFERDSSPQSVDTGVCGHTLHFDFIDFLDPIACGGDIVREVAIVREEEQSFSVEVEASYWMKFAERRRQQFHDQRATFGIGDA